MNDVTIKQNKSGKKANLLFNKFISVFAVAAFGYLFSVFVSFFDSMVSGNLLSSEALNAVQIISPITSFISFVANLGAVGISTLYFTYLNKSENKKAKNLAGTGLIFTIIIGACTSLLLFLIMEPFINAYGLSQEAQAYARDYYLWYIALGFLIPLQNYFYEFISMDYDNSLKLIGDLGLAIVKVVLSFILIRILGINGLGLATVCSYAFCLLIDCLHFFKKKNSIHFSFTPSFKDLWKGIQLSFGSAISYLLSAVVSSLVNLFITSLFGSSYLVIMTIISFEIRLAGTLRKIPTSIKPSMTAAIGTNNSNDFDLCLSIIKKTFIICTPILMAIVMACSPAINLLYHVNPGSEIYFLCIIASLVTPITFFCTGMVRTYSTVYMTLGKSSIFIIDDIISAIFKVGVSCLFGYLFGIIGFIVGMTVSYIATFVAITLYIYFMNHPHCIFKRIETDESQQSFDFYLNEENINFFMNEFSRLFKDNGVNENFTNEYIKEMGDLYNTALFYNKNNRVINRVTICIGNDYIRILNKNNGVFIAESEKNKHKNNKEKYPLINAIMDKETLDIYLSSSLNFVGLKFKKDMVY